MAEVKKLKVTLVRACWIDEDGQGNKQMAIGKQLELPATDARYLIELGKAVEGHVKIEPKKVEEKKAEAAKK